MKAIWSLFTQTVTAALAGYFVIVTLRPDWLHAGPQGLVSPPPQTTRVTDLSTAAQIAAPAVVAINTRTLGAQTPNDEWLRFFFGHSAPERSKDGLGSGVIVDSDRGLILTNHHVVTDADQMIVTLADGRQASAALLGDDPETDLAVIQIKLPRLQSIELGDSALLKVGEPVLAIGNPYGVGLTVTAGIVSALGRTELGINTFENFIQTDAAINPGNSGGALVNAAGQLIGINTAIFSESGGSMGIGFAIPTSLAWQVTTEIVKSGSVVRGWLGIEPQSLTPELAEALGSNTDQGVVVAAVIRPGPAASAGIQPGDVILSMNGQPVQRVAQLLSLVAQSKPGQKVELEVQRQKATQKLFVDIARRPAVARPTGR